VARLYRKSLKTLSSWVIDRDIFLEEATKLRNRFDGERGCSNAKAVRLLKVRKIEREFKGFLYEYVFDILDVCCVQ
jgi:NADH dehydrogenase (ubiquinone) 1 beta subcomplex subunit 9